MISSQTSTLTRNVGPEAMRLNLMFGGATDLTCVIDSDDGEEGEESEQEEEIMEKALENAVSLVCNSGQNESYLLSCD